MNEKKLPPAPKRTTPGFVFSLIGRALIDCLGERQFGKAEMAAVLAFFDAREPECVFCGGREVKRWDHLVPVRQGGETVLGNMVLACGPCDDSKQDRPYKEWMLGDAPLSPRSREIPDLQRHIQRIEAYVAHFGYRPRPVEMRLTANELERLHAIESNLEALRSEIDVLIGDFKARTGNR